MNNKIVFGQYYNSNSWIHRLDPRVKISTVILFMICLFIVKSIFVLLGFLAFLLILIITSKVPLAKFFNSIKMMTFVLILTFFLQLIFRKDGYIIESLSFNLTYLSIGLILATLVLWILFSRHIKFFKNLILIIIVLGLFSFQYFVSFGGLITTYKIDIYSSGLIMASYVILRIVALVVISSLLTLTTTPTELNNGLEKMLAFLNVFKIKVSILTMMISIALRFIPTLINESDKILKAQASRGSDFSEGRLKERISQIVSLIVPMFVIAYKRAYDLADAMEARGYVPGSKRSSIYVLKYHLKDFLVYAFDVIILFVTIFVRVKYAL